MSRAGTYYALAKPGIIYGNALPAIAGFFLASRGHFHPGLFLAMLVGLSLVIGSGCVFNNYRDRDIDAKMDRTKGRALVSGSVSPRNALIYGAVLGLAGTLLLALGTNPLTAAVALFGFFFYVGPYGTWKRRSVHGTLVGSISGAVPPVVGYCAVSGRLDLAALIMFLILVVWQMPHFYAIAIYRSADYAAAGIPVLPLKRGVPAAKRQMLGYVITFAVTSALLSFCGYAGHVYLAIALAISLGWLYLSIKGFKPGDDNLWARKMFRFSLVALTTLCASISLGL